MANIASQKKRIQRTERERQENRRFTTAVKTHFRRLESAVEEGSDVESEHRELVAMIDKAIKNGVMHKNTGARKKRRAAKLAAGS